MIYGTYGSGCEHFRFKRIRPGVYQRVVRLFLIWWPVGQRIREHDCNYFPLDTAGVEGDKNG